MANHPIITVIIPVYNAESTLARCVDSLLGQTFTDFEVLLIDDGSRDASPALCDAYAARDPRVRVFHKENGGVSTARNVGLDNTKGEYVTFVDSDDWVGTRYLESFTHNLDADLIVGSAIEVGGLQRKLYLEGQEGRSSSVNSVISELLNQIIISVPWGKLFRRCTIGSLRFDVNMRVAEDTCFVVNCLSACGSLRILPFGKEGEAVYFYVAPPSIESKYQLPVVSAVYHLKTLYHAYERLGGSCKSFEVDFPQSFYEYCSNDLSNNGSVWYNDKEIRRICLRRSHHKGLTSYLMTWLAFAGFYRIKLIKQYRRKKY